MAKASVRSFSLEEMKDKYIGKKGSGARDKYEYELSMDVLDVMINKARQERNLSQKQLK